MLIGNSTSRNNISNSNLLKQRKHNAECIVDQDGIKILVSYWYEKSPSDVYEAHGYHELGNVISTELESVEVVLGEGAKAIDILALMNPVHKEYVLSKLKYD